MAQGMESKPVLRGIIDPQFTLNCSSGRACKINEAALWSGCEVDITTCNVCDMYKAVNSKPLTGNKWMNNEAFRGNKLNNGFEHMYNSKYTQLQWHS